MSNNLFALQTSNKTNNINNSSIKLLIFEIGILTLALPVHQVQKVIRQTEVHGSGLSYVNLSHLGERLSIFTSSFLRQVKLTLPTKKVILLLPKISRENL